MSRDVMSEGDNQVDKKPVKKNVGEMDIGENLKKPNVSLVPLSDHLGFSNLDTTAKL